MTVTRSRPMTCTAVAGSAVAGSTSVAPISVRLVIEPSPAIVWNGITNSQVSSGPVCRPQPHAGAVEAR